VAPGIAKSLNTGGSINCRLYAFQLIILEVVGLLCHARK
jgi:hypothetical protein